MARRTPQTSRKHRRGAPARKRPTPAAPPWWQRHRGWLLGAVAYGFAWPWLDGLNLSWLAWGAFVPLFAALRPVERFWPFAGRAYGFLTLATVIYCTGWFFGVPGFVRLATFIGGSVQIFLLGVPLLGLFVLKKHLPYEQALLALVLLWPCWDWLAHFLPLSLNTLLVGNSQGANTWLIQYADLFGVWAITAWVLLFNVLLYRAWRAAGEAFTRPFRVQALRVAAILLLIPLAYAGLRYVTLAPEGDPIRVTMISTNAPPVRGLTERRISNIERVVHLTDSTDYYRQGQPRPDLYVWSEGTLGFDWSYNDLRGFLYQAIDDWQTPLLTGTTMRSVRAGTPPDTVYANQAALIHAGGDATRTVHAYSKMHLMPVQEGIPGYRFLKRFEAVRAYERANFLLTPGEAVTLLPLTTRDGRTVQLGTPICHEVNYPALWAEMTRTGADVFIQLNFESWFGSLGFQNILANLTRIRAIENRRSVARSANGGPTVFFDAFGRSYGAAPHAESSTTAEVATYSGTTLHTRFPALFPLLCLLALVGLVVVSLRQA